KDSLEDGSFYTEMQNTGIPLHKDGQVNLNGILQYSKYRHDQLELEAKLEEANKPGEIPDAKPEAAQQPAADAPMTAQMARAIMIQDKNHPRFQEAQEFMHKQVA